MSSLGSNYSADPTGSIPAPSAVDASTTPAAASASTAPAASAPSDLNPHPTVIVLDTPYELGDLAPDAKYPHLYITTLFVNGPALQITIQYEYGVMQADGWHGIPYASNRNLTLNGMDLVPFFTTEATGTDPLWNQIEALIYKTIQENDARAAGTVATL